MQESGQPLTDLSPEANGERAARWRVPLAGAALAAAAVMAYAGSFSLPFHFDDMSSIPGNPSIRHLASAFFPPINRTVTGRPFLNLSLAVNYAISGTSAWSYHATNLAIHVLAGLTLFGIVRRTLASRWRGPSTAAAFSVALLWTLHPLQTGAVTYVIQRAESLMGLLYLLTLYCFLRGAGAGGPSRRLWFAASVSACLLGMATKEVMASAPLIVLLYDRAFVAGSFREAWRRRWSVHASLAATWLILAYLVFFTQRSGTVAGVDGDLSWWRYGLTQFPAITHYLKLCLLPFPLVFDYGTVLVPPSFAVLPYALFIAGLLAATAWALARHPSVGFLGAAFFAILAPSSSIVPVVGETMADYRMYLPLAAVLALTVVGLFSWLGRAALPVCLAAAAGLGLSTAARNRDYSSEQSIWADTVAKRPDNFRAHNNLAGILLATPGRLNEAVAQFREAVRLRPDSAEAHNNLGNALAGVPGGMDEAVSQYREALRLKPDLVGANLGLGNALLGMPGRLGEAIACYEAAVRSRPDSAEGHFNLGNALSMAPGRLDDAVAQYEEALRLRPDYAKAHFGLAVALLRWPDRTGDAAAHLEAGLRLEPGDALARRILSEIRARKP
jgi:Flp pilus assembly protein TadD